MTKVQLEYDLVRPLGDDDLTAIARVNGVYGFERVILRQPGLDGIMVEYDASRLTRADVEAGLVKNGIPIVRS